jgi:hypothetical protein
MRRWIGDVKRNRSLDPSGLAIDTARWRRLYVFPHDETDLDFEARGTDGVTLRATAGDWIRVARFDPGDGLS